MADNKILFPSLEKPHDILVFAGGDPTHGHVLERHYFDISEAQWHWLSKLLENAAVFDPRQEVPAFKCSCCGEWFPGTIHRDLAEYIALNLHHPGCISFYNPGHRCSFLLCGTSQTRGCVHRVLEIIELAKLLEETNPIAAKMEGIISEAKAKK